MVLLGLLGVLLGLGVVMLALVLFRWETSSEGCTLQCFVIAQDIFQALTEDTVELEKYLQDVHEIFEYALSFRLQIHIFKGRLFQESLSDLTGKHRI